MSAHRSRPTEPWHAPAKPDGYLVFRERLHVRRLGGEDPGGWRLTWGVQWDGRGDFLIRLGRGGYGVESFPRRRRGRRR